MIAPSDITEADLYSVVAFNGRCLASLVPYAQASRIAREHANSTGLLVRIHGDATTIYVEPEAA